MSTAKKKKTTNKKKAPAKKKALATPKSSRKKVPVKSSSRVSSVSAKKRRAARPKKPLRKFHINQKSWDKPAVMTEICSEVISSSYSLVTICNNDNDLPTAKTVFMWMSDELRAGGLMVMCDEYARAKEIQADYIADEMFDIADDGSNDWMEKRLNNGDVVEVLNTEHVQRSKLRIDTRKWVASKLKPKKYGDKLELSGDAERPLSSLTDEELTAKLLVLSKMMADAGLAK